MYIQKIQAQKKSFHISKIRQNKLRNSHLLLLTQGDIKTQLSGNIRIQQEKNYTKLA